MRPEDTAMAGGDVWPPIGPDNDTMTLRDYFAAAALTGILTKYNDEKLEGMRMSDWAEEAYDFADAMLAARTDRIPNPKE